EASTPEEGRRTILLVEDNPKVRATMAAALVQAGYRVFEASAGDEAVGLFREHPDVDLLLTDIVMPGDIQGTDLAKALRERSPDLAIVFVSGYASDETVRGAGLRADDIRLMKPVRRADLLRAVANALADRRPSGV
ncbi:MAG: response regulator, partial [Myxococcota bacterium]